MSADVEVEAAEAATLVILRDAPPGGDRGGVSAFFVQRSPEAKFMGGHVVFPGGRVDAGDRDPRWEGLCSDPIPSSDPEAWRALGIAACREALEEAALLPVVGRKLDHATLLDFRARLEGGAAFRDLVEAEGLVLDLAGLHAFARWVTPRNQSKRFDTRFFAVRAPEGQEGAHDARETIASFWASPAEVLARFEAERVQLAPPTHRVLEILSRARSVDDVFAYAARASLEPICPEPVRHTDAQGETIALTLPGDPAHSVREVRVEGASRYVFRDGRWRPGMAPPGDP